VLLRQCAGNHLFECINRISHIALGAARVRFGSRHNAGQSATP
jgi:hypothetical protein